MSVARSIFRMSVLPLVVHLPSPRSLLRDHGPTATRRSPPLRSLHLMVVLPMRRSASRCILQRFTPHKEIVNYSKEDPLNVVHLRKKACYNLVKERGTDEGFWTFFHQDWYRTMLYPKSSPVVKQQYVDIEYMMNKKDMHFNMIFKACDLHGITDLL
jgi:hypothetical protein